MLLLVSTETFSANVNKRMKKNNAEITITANTVEDLINIADDDTTVEAVEKIVTEAAEAKAGTFLGWMFKRD